MPGHRPQIVRIQSVYDQWKFYHWFQLESHQLVSLRYTVRYSECYRHKDYVQIATIIRFLISDCQEENTFEYYYEKVNEIKMNLPAAKKQNYVE